MLTSSKVEVVKVK